MSPSFHDLRERFTGLNVKIIYHVKNARAFAKRFLCSAKGKVQS